MKKIKKPVTVITIFLLVSFGLSVLYFANFSSNNGRLPDDLYKKFGCDRLTLDVRSTDKYCRHYELYKADRAKGLVE